jgi:NADPH:quinone reductase-like Zn-dependent oxidoreductase
MTTAIQVAEWGGLPTVALDPGAQSSGGEILVRLTAAAVNPVDIAIASGRFYGDLPALPYIVGAEAVGEVIEGPADLLGRRVWCLATSGLWASRFTVSAEQVVQVPEGIDDVTAVTLGIGGLPGWMGVRERGALSPAETVLVLGAGGAVGQIAIHAAVSSGAGRVVGAARSASGRERARVAGAEAVVDLSDPDGLSARIHTACEGSADLVIDTVWGEPALTAIGAMARGGRLVQIGNAAGATVAIPAGPLRGGRLDIRGYSVFRESHADLTRAYRELAESVRGLDRSPIATKVRPFAEITDAWCHQRDASDGVKQVLVPD